VGNEHSSFADKPSNRFPIDRIGLILGPALMLGWLAWAPVAPNPEAHRLAGILLLTITWWLTEPIPIAATGLVAVTLTVLIGAVPVTGGDRAVKIAFAPFGDPTVFFLLGGMFIGRAMERHGLDRRIALSILTARWASRSPSALLMATGLAVMLVSMWISNTAATSMVFPVTMGIISVLSTGSAHSESFARSPFASALLLMTAYASTVGGLATPIGTTTNVVAIGLFRQKEYFGQSADFFRWMLVGIPLMLTLGGALFLWLRLQAPVSAVDLPRLRKYLAEEHSRLGRWSRGEVNTLIVFLTVVGLWIAPSALMLVDTEYQAWFSKRFPEEAVAVLAPILLFLLPIDWRQRQFSLDASDFRRIDWSTLLLFGAGLSLGTLMFKTGLAKTLGDAAFSSLDTHDVWIVTAACIAGAIFLSEFTSNATTATMLIPVVMAICREAGVDALPPLMGVALGASFGSTLPVSTPPNAIVYGSGLIPVRRMIRAGIGVDIVSGIVIWIVLRVAFGLGWSVFPT